MPAMLSPGQVVRLEVEKPAAGGRMIARDGGLVVLVSGAIPGETASVVIERVGKGVAYGKAVAIERASPDRRDSAADTLCGGLLYAHIAYPRQLVLKAQVIADAFTRIARLPWSSDIAVAPSPAQGYRMRARLHLRETRLGFFREGTHDLCDARATGQLLSTTCDVLDTLASSLRSLGCASGGEVELSENLSASERVVHIGSDLPLDPHLLAGLANITGLTGLTVTGSTTRDGHRAEVLSGMPYVNELLAIGPHVVPLRHHVLAFFQANRFLLEHLVAHVIVSLRPNEEVVDLYAGVGVFACAAAIAKGARVTAVEGEEVSAADLAHNADSLSGAVTAVHQSVEAFTGRQRRPPSTVIIDPPRTGMSREALQGAIALKARQVIYISCDVATLARDARRFVDAGYQPMAIDGFDLFPNTPHIETVARFERTSSIP